MQLALGEGFAHTVSSGDNYARALLRHPPTRFLVDLIPPRKLGGDYYHGMRICRISRGDRSSVSSGESYGDYEIWRNWEDCLWFQDDLESKYAEAARMKRKRLQRGKGVKKNGMYLQDRASSFESLPPGPAPESVSLDIHKHIPRLSKKGSVFKTSISTAEKRQENLESFIQALFDPDLPALIHEIRNELTHFFGYRKKDRDLSISDGKKFDSRSSMTLSTYSSSTLRPQSSPSKSVSSERTRCHSVATTLETFRSIPPSELSIDTSSTTLTESRARKLSTSSESSSNSDGSADHQNNAITPTIADEDPIDFDYNPQHRFGPHGTTRSISPLGTLPEIDDTQIPKDQSDFPRRKPAILNKERGSNRHCSVYASPAASPDSGVTEFASNDGAAWPSSIRESWQSTSSNGTISAYLGVSMPSDIPERWNRESMASISSILTYASADAVRPPTPPPRIRDEDTFSSIRASATFSISDFDIESESGYDGDISSLVDAFPRPVSYIPEEPISRPETPTGHPKQSNNNKPTFIISEPPPSPTTSMASTSLTVSTTSDFSSSGAPSISIKAVYNNSIIILRLRRDIPFAEARQRIYNKFVGQEGVPLSQAFTIAAMDSPKSPPRSKANKVSSGSITDDVDLYLINHAKDWDSLLKSLTGPKIILRIIDSPS